MEESLATLAKTVHLQGIGDVCLFIALWCLALTVKQCLLYYKVKKLEEK